MNKAVNMLSPKQIVQILKTMKLSGMAQKYEQMHSEPSYQHLSVDEMLGILVDYESRTRGAKRAQRCLSRSGMIPQEPFNQAFIELGIYNSARGPKRVVCKLASCSWIKDIEPYNLVLIAALPTTGKTWLLLVVGKAACEKGIPVRYIRFSKLMEEMEDAREHKQLTSYRNRLNRNKLLIIDDFGVDPMPADMASNLLTLLEERYCHASTVLAGQMSTDLWHEYLGQSRSADAILDRVLNSSYIVELRGPSLRENKARREL